MIRGKYLTSNDDISPVIAVRRAVFVDEQGYSSESEPDEHDQMAIYALALNDDDRPIATGRLFVEDDRIWLGRFCTLKEYRGQGIGDFIMRMLLYRAQDMNIASITLSAQTHAVGFYAKYGFEPFGDIILDEGQPHQLMRLNASNIDLSGKCD